jgi:hypothetical protein
MAHIPRAIAAVSESPYPQWFSAFLADCAVRKPSPHTVKAYRQDFVAIAELLAGRKAQIAALKPCDITKGGRPGARRRCLPQRQAAGTAHRHHRCTSDDRGPNHRSGGRLKLTGPTGIDNSAQAFDPHRTRLSRGSAGSRQASDIGPSHPQNVGSTIETSRVSAGRWHRRNLHTPGPGSEVEVLGCGVLL